MSTSLPTCYGNSNACREDCATWTSDTLGGRCDCTTEVDAVFTCAQGATGLICGRLSQGVPRSDACLPAYLQAFKCAGKVAPCTTSLTEIPIDDFEAGAAGARYPGFASS